MASRSPASTQLDLFAAPGDVQPQLVVAQAEIEPELRTVGDRLPASIYLGTSSWAFPGWRGIVYAPTAAKTKLSRHGLAAYSQHPLFRAVGVDRTYYAPISAADFAAYAEAVPDTFRFLVKAHELCTLAVFRASGRYAPYAGERNAHFLDSHYATDQVVGPCVEGLGAKAGPILFQFPPQSVAMLGGAEAFIDRLHAFLDGLPRGPIYAVELRNKELLTSAYVEALHDTGVEHCFNVHPSMPPLHEQREQVGAASGRELVLRWMLHPTLTYETARTLYEPFDQLVNEDPTNRSTIAQMCLAAATEGRPAMVIVNNKAEGSSPLTVRKLAEQIVQTSKMGR